MKNERHLDSEKKRVRHARTPFHVASCQDCGRDLHVTHITIRFGGRCRSCYSSFHVADMSASLVVI